MPTEKSNTKLECCIRKMIDVAFNDRVCTFSFPRQDRIIYAITDIDDDLVVLTPLLADYKEIRVSYWEFQETFIYMGKGYATEPRVQIIE